MEKLKYEEADGWNNALLELLISHNRLADAYI